MSGVALLFFAVILLALLSKGLGWAKEPQPGLLSESEDDHLQALEDFDDDQDKWTNPDRWLERGESHPPGQPAELHYWSDEEK